MKARFPSILALVSGAALSSHARAQLWDGGGTNNNWGTANNWNPNGVPVNDGTANVGFGGLLRLAPVVNGAVDVRSITFVSGAGSFDVNSGGFHFFLQVGAGGVTNSDNSTQTISNPIRLSAAQTWRATNGDLVFGAVDGQGNALTINGGFNTTINRYSGTSSSLVKSGSGTLFLTGDGSSSGGITINAGTLSIDAGSRLGNNDVVINGGALAATADITTLRNITLTAAAASLNAATHQLSLDDGALTVNGGGVTSASGFLGVALPSNATAIINGGGGSSWTMTGSFAVGYQDQGTLRVEAGGGVSSGISHIGSLPGSSGVATVTGSGSTWTSSGFLGVGYSGTGTLNIEAGGSVSAVSSFAGADPGSIGHVNVAGGAWSVTGSPVIGEQGVGTMTISGGGTLADSGGFIARMGSGDGDVLVTGTGSAWTTTGALMVASSGTGRLTVQAGGAVSCTGDCMIGAGTGGDGTATITGATLTTGDIYVGFAGVGRLNIGPGGTVSSAEGSVAGTSSANGSAATIDGTDARWTMSGDLSVGDGGVGSLTIQNGGVVSDHLANVGMLLSGAGTAVVTGAGSSWTSDNLAVGYLSGHGSLSVQNGGHVTCGNGSIGNSSGTGTATVTGAGSVWDIPGAISIGFNGSGTLLLDQGGRMTTALVSLGFGGGSNATATIAGANSSWAIGFGFQMCDNGSSGTLNINGGTVTIGGDITDGGAGVSTLTLDGGTLDMQNHNIGTATPIDNLAFRSGTLRNVTGINNGAGLSKTGPGTLLLNTANTYAGTTTINQGVLMISNAGGSATGTGSVSVAPGGALTGTGRVTGAVTNNGSVAPGISPGTLRLAGAYTQNSGGSLNIEIGGAVAGTQYDRLAATGAANLNGSLNVTLANGFAPAIGNTFDILTAGSRIGTFTTVNLPPLNSGAWAIEYLPTIVRLSITGCPADFNGDGFLDFFDADAFVSCFEGVECPPGRDADYNGDGFVDFFDSDAFVADFEAGC